MTTKTMALILTVILAGAGSAGEKTKASVPASFGASEPLKIKDLEFQALCQATWPAPAAGGMTPLQLQLRVINRGKDPVQFLPILGMPRLKPVDGKDLEPQCHGNDHIRRLPKLVAVEPGKSATVKEPARLIANEKGAALIWEDEGGSVWSYDGLRAGKYLLSLHYRTTGKNGEWTGDLRTKPVEVEIRELKASASVTADDLEVRALADAVWPAPAADKPSLIHLGFRVTKVNGPNWDHVDRRAAALEVDIK